MINKPKLSVIRCQNTLNFQLTPEHLQEQLIRFVTLLILSIRTTPHCRLWNRVAFGNTNGWDGSAVLVKTIKRQATLSFSSFAE
jgi:hypothetical protein